MNDNIQKLLEDKYFEEGENSWEDIVNRVSKLCPPIEKDLLHMKFIPSSPTLMNGNTKTRQGTLSSCFPMRIDDSIDGIYEPLWECAKVTKAGGGIGLDFSNLRSSQEGIRSLGGRKSSGPIGFLKNYDSMLGVINQGGARRGAGMAMLNIDHPDIIPFIKAKENINDIEMFNMSIRVTNDFYDKLENTPDAKHIVKYKDGTEVELEITVKQLWDLIIRKAWETGEPGIFNSDIAYQQCTVTNVDKHVLSNPCAEFTGIPYQSCNLGSINLSKLVTDGSFDWTEFHRLIIAGTNFLNDIIDKNKYPIKEIEERTLNTRPIGLGMMGFAHMLFKLKIPYNSPKAFKLADQISYYLTIVSMHESTLIAEKKGAYKDFDYETFVKANERIFKKEPNDNFVNNIIKRLKTTGIYNSSTTSIAPTGNISFIGQTTSGIEPLFALIYDRDIIDIENNTKYSVTMFDPIFKEYLDKYDPREQEDIIDYVIANKGSCQGCGLIPEEMQKVFVVAGDISAKDHLNMLGSIAPNISLSVSKTINLPKSATEKEISDVYTEAHKKGIIGVAVYRDGSRDNVLKHQDHSSPKKRPKVLRCHIYRITVKGEKWIVFVGLNDEPPFNGDPYEVFAGKIAGLDIPKMIIDGEIVKVKRGHYQFKYDDQVLVDNILDIFEAGEQEAVTRLVSSLLRKQEPIEYINDQLAKIKGALIVDFCKSITKAFKRYLKEMETGEVCNCGGQLIYIDGCKQCPICGNAKCG